MTAVPGPLPWERLAARLAAPRPLLACFDYDGTLAPIAPTPEEASVPEETRAALAELAACPATAVAVVSGRPVAELRGFLGDAAGGLWLVGHHGLGTAAPGEAERFALDAEELRGRLAPLRRLGEELAARHRGVRLEDKTATVALHTRLAGRAAAADAADAFRRAAAGLDGFATIDGKEVVEVRPEGVDKGTTVARLADDFHAAHGDGAVLYVGDDTTDEDAFRRLRDRPGAVTVRVADRVDPAATAARFHVASPRAVAGLLRRLVALRRT